MDEAFLAEVRSHDARMARGGLEIWLGSEPTFTHPRSQHPCWLTEAEGGEKAAHARSMLLGLAPRLGGRVRLSRVAGRHYPGESAPRWCFGALFDRNASPSGLPADTSQLDIAGLASTPAPREDQAWLTFTPDPGVVEINMAPAPDLETFARWCQDIYVAAGEVGLSPTRFRYNGDISDSGGGGQITFGGPTAERSPFFVWPQLLPGLVRYLNRHPALSYLFAPPCCGSASQGPRADESVRERFDELPIALDYLASRGEAATPSELWGMLGGLLVDATGCAHRAEINIEKLWNPWLAGRGQLGLVELRALRMPPTAARLTALAALFRGLLARLAVAPYLEPIVDWGQRLHEEYSLPWNLERDLERVLADLDGHGFGLGPRMREELTAKPEPLVRLQLGDAALEVRPAVSFWPLIGDLAAQEARGARMVDSSASRVELLVSAAPGAPVGRIAVNGWRVPMQGLSGGAGARAIGSVVYRAFVPRPGLHPSIPAHDPLVIEWQRGDGCARADLYSWQPGGGSYAGLPADQVEARARRSERVVITSLSAPSEMRVSEATSTTLDLRRLR